VGVAFCSGRDFQKVVEVGLGAKGVLAELIVADASWVIWLDRRVVGWLMGLCRDPSGLEGCMTVTLSLFIVGVGLEGALRIRVCHERRFRGVD
jgi:hypothetical protein